MYKPRFNQRKALRFRQFQRKGYALFASLGRVVTIGVLSVATLESATAAHPHVSTDGEVSDTTAIAEKEATLDDIEVTGSRAPLAIGQAARMVTVLSREDIQAAPVQSINDLLKMAAGVDVRQRGAIGAQTDVGIRGGTQEQITILLNGINICDPQTGHNAFDLPCDISDILRIEVLEGPAARVYGTSSMAGAINIVTWSAGVRRYDGAEARGRDGAEARGRDGAEVRIEGGSFGYLSTAGRATLADHSLSASYKRSDGYSRAKSGALNADYEGVKVFYQGGVKFPSPSTILKWHAGMSVKGFGSNTFYSARYDEQYEHTVKLFTALQGEVTAGDRLHLKPAVYWNRSYDRFELIRGSESKVPFNYHRTDVFGINLNSWFDWKGGRTAFGAEFRHEDIVSSNLGEPLNGNGNGDGNGNGKYRYGLKRSNITLHLEHNILLQRFTLSAGFIATASTSTLHTSLQGGAGGRFLYPGIDASYRFGSHWKVYASYNESLRLPSFTELYYSVGGHKADKNLKPEELRAVEGGVKYGSPTVTAKASIFYHHSSNLIDWVMDSREADPVWQSVNLTKVNTLGQEVTVNVQRPWYNVQLSYCHLHQKKDLPDYLQSQYALEYLRNKVTAAVKVYLPANIDLSLYYRFQDRTGSYTSAGGDVCNYHPYSVVDCRLAWHAEKFDIHIDANNLFGTRYVDYGNVPQPGCWLLAGAKVCL